MERCDVCLIRTNQESHDGHEEEDRRPKLSSTFLRLTEKLEPTLGWNDTEKQKNKNLMNIISHFSFILFLSRGDKEENPLLKKEH